MKEKLNSNLAGNVPFSPEDSQNSSYNGKAANLLALQTRQRKKLWNTHEVDCCNIVDGLSRDTETVIRVSPTDDLHGPLVKHLNGVKGTNMLKYDGNDKDVLLNSPKLERSIIMNDYANHNREPVDSVPPVITSSELLQADKNICTDEDDVLNYEPESIDCYKEINYNVVKEECVDEGMPFEDKGFIELHFGNYSRPCTNVYTSDKESGDHNFELFIHDGLKVSSEADDGVHTGNRCLAKEVGNTVSPFASKFTCLSDLMKMDYQNPEVLLQASEKDAGKGIENYVLDKQSIVTRALPIKEFGRGSYPRSFMNISNRQEDEAHLPKQVIEHANEDARHQECVLDNKSESPSFISEVLTSSLYGSYMNIHQENGIKFYKGHSANTFEARCTGMDEKAVSGGQNADMDEYAENIHQQPIAANKIVDSEGPFLLNDSKNLSETMSIQKSPQILWHEALSSSSPANSEVSSAGMKEISGKQSFTYQGEACDIEAISCAVSGQITDSGPETYSGNNSLRSESSNTSARSFAFPVLQTEWNSSPVRMGDDANRERVRKISGSWKQGILCCRF